MNLFFHRIMCNFSENSISTVFLPMSSLKVLGQSIALELPLNNDYLFLPPTGVNSCGKLTVKAQDFHLPSLD